MKKIFPYFILCFFSITSVVAQTALVKTTKHISQDLEDGVEYVYEEGNDSTSTLHPVNTNDIYGGDNIEIEYVNEEGNLLDSHSSNYSTYSAPLKVVKRSAITKTVSRVKRKQKNYSKKEIPSVTEMESIWKNELYATDDYDSIFNAAKNYNKEKVDYQKLSTNTLMERLEELNDKTPFNIEYNPILENVIKDYLKYRKRGFERMIALSQYYFPLFEKELDNYQIPMEIKYLAIVESALKPRIKSHVGATGLWQFMYETGKMHDLKVNSYIDERMDPIKSTKAACQYLSRLYKTFNDWDLALAAYNSGPGNVMKAIRRAGGKKNYWNIRSYLPKETAGYLPAFLATMYIFEYANEHGLKRERPQYALYETDTVKIKKKVTFHEISKAIDIDVKELEFLNPSYKLGIIPNSKSNRYSLRIPTSKMGDYIVYENKIYELANKREAQREKSMYYNYSKTRKFNYKVRSGDYLGKIASRFNTSVAMIKNWNNLRSSKIKVGQNLTIFRKGSSEKKVAFTE